MPELEVTNPLAEDVLLYDGEELVGAKQNRILNVTVLVPSRANLVVPVSCVEQGRWRSVSPRFAAARHVAHLRLRRAKAEALHAEVGSPVGPVQDGVWSEVRATLERLELPSPTLAARDADAAHEAAIDALAGAFAAEPGQCGTVLGLADTLCLDVVSRPDAFARLWPKLRRGYSSTRSPAPTAARPESSGCSASSTRSPTLPYGVTRPSVAAWRSAPRGPA